MWLHLGFPRYLLAASDTDSFVWRMQVVADHVREDMPQLGIVIAVPAMLRFWNMLAHNGKICSAAPLAQSMGVS